LIVSVEPWCWSSGVLPVVRLSCWLLLPCWSSCCRHRPAPHRWDASVHDPVSPVSVQNDLTCVAATPTSQLPAALAMPTGGRPAVWRTRADRIRSTPPCPYGQPHARPGRITSIANIRCTARVPLPARRDSEPRPPTRPPTVTGATDTPTPPVTRILVL